jgi:aminoglycoside phosphotransferase family enzyme/predicted kinase
MITEDQTPIVDFLASPSAHGGDAVERIDTHTAIVVLAGARAYKLKRAVRFDYLDFSTVEQRRRFCEAEVRLNRRTAPTLYRRVAAVTRQSDGSLALGGSGEPVDWVVEMNRFPQEGLLDRLAGSGRLDPGLMEPLAAAVAALHGVAGRRPDHGGRDGMAWVIDGNASGFTEFGAPSLDPAACSKVIAATRRELERRADLLDARRRAGFVRECHGDLHLRNIVVLDGRPTLFDGIEFNERISCTDVLYDLAFLLMDLWRRGLPGHASAVWNRYLSETWDLNGVPLLPLFLSCRAAVRAKTSATAAKLQNDARRRDELQGLAREYLAMAEAFLHPTGASLIGIGGFSGSGKSVLARALAPSIGPVPGAIVLRSDVVRKRLLGVEPRTRLGPEGYTSDVSLRVYAALVEQATEAVRGGHAVIVDAVHAQLAERHALARAAAQAGVPFAGIWLDAPESTLIARIEARRNDVSDADADIVRMQCEKGAGAIDWRRLDASAPLAEVERTAADMWGPALAGPDR